MSASLGFRGRPGIETVEVLLRDPRRQRRFQNFADRSEVVVGNPAAELENVRPQQRSRDPGPPYRLNLDARRRRFRIADDEAFDFGGTKAEP